MSSGPRSTRTGSYMVRSTRTGKFQARLAMEAAGLHAWRAQNNFYNLLFHLKATYSVTAPSQPVSASASTRRQSILWNQAARGKIEAARHNRYANASSASQMYLFALVACSLTNLLNWLLWHREHREPRFIFTERLTLSVSAEEFSSRLPSPSQHSLVRCGGGFLFRKKCR